MTALYCYDDAHARQFEPFALTRPVSELRVGARLIRERWELATGATARGFVAGAHLDDFEEPGAAEAMREALPAGALLVNSRFAPELARLTEELDVAECDGSVVAVRLAEPLALDALADGALALDALAGDRPRSRIAGFWVEEVWDLLTGLETRLRLDLELLSRTIRVVDPHYCAVVGDYRVHAASGAVIEPFVTFDCTKGPVVLEAGATVQSNTRIQGPTWIGAHSIVGGDKITICAIGDHCKVHGEVSNVVMLGYANKAHDGFVGQSYVGRWVNLGANTVTSNLKNTYGTVALWTPAGTRDTGEQFLGTLFGDHAKTGIAITLTTGTVMGAGAQVFGAEIQPKVIPPFAWGEKPPYDTFELERFLQVAQRVMARRDIELGERGIAQLRAAFALRWSGEE